MLNHLDGAVQRLSFADMADQRPTVREQRRQLVQQSIQTMRMGVDPRFTKLRKRFIQRIIVFTALFFGFYLSYVFLTAYARDFAAVQVIGSINIALILGIAQFTSTLVLAWGYSRCATRTLDPLAEELRAEMAETSAARHRWTVRL